jgi:hypothetical protein
VGQLALHAPLSEQTNQSAITESIVPSVLDCLKETNISEWPIVEVLVILNNESCSPMMSTNLL